MYSFRRVWGQLISSSALEFDKFLSCFYDDVNIFRCRFYSSIEKICSSDDVRSNRCGVLCRCRSVIVLLFEILNHITPSRGRVSHGLYFVQCWIC